MNRRIAIDGAEFLADAEGALYWPAQQALIVADLHFEKASSYAPFGRFIPPYDTSATLDRLVRLIDRYRARLLICLGDSFHDEGGIDRLDRGNRARLTQLAREIRIVWIAGNHDPGAGFEGECVASLTLDGVRLCHEPEEGGGVALCGHYHPTATVALRLRRFTGRCFAYDRKLMILPAFGTFTGGLDVANPAIARHFRDGFEVALMARNRLMVLPHSELEPRA